MSIFRNIYIVSSASLEVVTIVYLQKATMLIWSVDFRKMPHQQDCIFSQSLNSEILLKVGMNLILEISSCGPTAGGQGSLLVSPSCTTQRHIEADSLSRLGRYITRQEVLPAHVILLLLPLHLFQRDV